MIKRTLYRCEYCNTEYASENAAIECERIHKKLTNIKRIDGTYKSMKSVPDGAPIAVTIRFDGDDKPYTYRR